MTCCSRVQRERFDKGLDWDLGDVSVIILIVEGWVQLLSSSLLLHLYEFILKLHPTKSPCMEDKQELAYVCVG